MNGWKARKLRRRAQRHWELGVVQECVGLSHELAMQVSTVGPLGIAYQKGREQARQAKADRSKTVTGMPIEVWALVLADAVGRGA